jgi:hypothetical protein
MGGIMTTLCRVLGTLLVAALVWIGPARATSFSTDQSDIWNAANEPGWAAEFVQRGSAIFAVIYVYNPSGYPWWYSATLEWTGEGTVFSWSGDLYVTSGPWFGYDPFDGAQVSIRKVGTMTWTAQSTNAGTLTYSVDNLVVTKNLQRVLIRYDNYAGRYGGGVHETVTRCTDSSLNGTREFPAAIEVLQTGLTVNVQTLASGSICTNTGQLSQAGQMGSAEGSFTCDDGSAGTFSYSEVQVNPQGITARYQATYANPAGCKASGWFGGVRGTTF